MAQAKSTSIDSLSSHYYTELARLTGWIFLGVLALMTFLLTVGLQHPQKLFAPFFYTAVILLALGLISYVVGQMLLRRSLLLDGDKQAGSLKLLGGVRMLQEFIFILSILAVLGLAIVSAHIFFATPAAPPTPAG